jgi:hypothetical protein
VKFGLINLNSLISRHTQYEETSLYISNIVLARVYVRLLQPVYVWCHIVDPGVSLIREGYNFQYGGSKFQSGRRRRKGTIKVEGKVVPML